ncbi:MAG: Lon protease family protein [Desulfatiglandales bacterium]
MEDKRVKAVMLRWEVDENRLPFETTADLEPLKETVGQARAVAALEFGVRIRRPGYNIFVTGVSGSGRLATVQKVLQKLRDGLPTPEDLCYVHNFKDPESPILLRFKGGEGASFKRDMQELVEGLKKEIPQIFESQEYINAKKEIMEAYEQKGKSFFKGLDQRVKEEGFALVDIQMGQIKRPEVVPLVDGNPMHIDQIEALVEKGRFPKEEFEQIKEKQAKLREQIDQIFMELRDLQKEVRDKLEQMDKMLFMKTAKQIAAPIYTKYKNEKALEYLENVLEDMAEHLEIFSPQYQAQLQQMGMLGGEVNPFHPYQVNLIVDNSQLKGPPIIIENYPNYKNLFGSIERVMDRHGVWRTDYTKIKAGSLIKANGGYLIVNLLDAILEPGVWPGLKRALKSQKVEIQTYDPFYLFTTGWLKPDPIEIDTKVIVLSDDFLYHLLSHYDEDMQKIFKVRADFDTVMDKDQEAIIRFAKFVRSVSEEEGLRPFSRSAVALLVEEAVRMAGRQEKISIRFPMLADIMREADFYALQEGKEVVERSHVEAALEARIYRNNLLEEHIQEAIDRGTLLIDVEGEVVGQVNGLAVYTVGGYTFGKPTRITASTSMGRAGIINIEREADLSGSTHNKGVLILAGYLRKKYAQDKPLTMSASIAFEQSYSGVDGDSASSTELYAILSSLANVPIKQYIAVTGSVNQKGEIQAIGGVNEKIEGFFRCCEKKGMTGRQGVMIPKSNLRDLMLRREVVNAVREGKFHIYAVSTVDEGIEILTGMKAGERGPDGSYPEGTVNYLVDKRLKEFVEGLKRLGEGEEESKEKGRKRIKRE